MLSPFRRSSSGRSTSSLEKRVAFMQDEERSKDSLPQYSRRHCPHRDSPPTPVLDAHLRRASTRARLEELRDALTDVIEADEDACIKCATTQAAGALFLYLKDIREAKKNGEYSKAQKKAWKQEIKGLAKDVKRDVKNEMQIG